MPNITPVDPQHPGDAADIIEVVKTKIGGVPNIFATMARSPAVLEGFLAYSGALGSGVLSTALREQIALVVAGENSCDYCASAHTYMAKNAGIAASEAKLNLQGKATDQKVAAILGFVQDVVRSRGTLDGNGSALNELRNAGVDDPEIVEILAHVGINIFTNYFNHVAQTEIDFPLVTTAANKAAA